MQLKVIYYKYPAMDDGFFKSAKHAPIFFAETPTTAQSIPIRDATHYPVAGVAAIPLIVAMFFSRIRARKVKRSSHSMTVLTGFSGDFAFWSDRQRMPRIDQHTWLIRIGALAFSLKKRTYAHEIEVHSVSYKDCRPLSESWRGGWFGKKWPDRRHTAHHQANRHDGQPIEHGRKVRWQALSSKARNTRLSCTHKPLYRLICRSFRRCFCFSAAITIEPSAHSRHLCRRQGKRLPSRTKPKNGVEEGCARRMQIEVSVSPRVKTPAENNTAGLSGNFRDRVEKPRLPDDFLPGSVARYRAKWRKNGRS